MRTSPTSSELQQHVGSSPGGAVASVEQLVGGTPLVRLRRSGEDRVLVKHEGYAPGGSFFDRVALRLLKGASRRVVVVGADAFALSVATIGTRRGHDVHVVVSGDSWRRLARLLEIFGATLIEVEEGGEDAGAAELVRAGASLLERRSSDALIAALRDVAEEVAEAGLRPTLWVLPDYGVEPASLRRALSTPGAEEPYLELVDDDGELRRTLPGPESARRAQTGQREGMLLSPQGAEIIEAAVNAAPEVDGLVVALVPEDGRRYLGWW